MRLELVSIKYGVMSMQTSAVRKDIITPFTKIQTLYIILMSVLSTGRFVPRTILATGVHGVAWFLILLPEICI